MLQLTEQNSIFAGWSPDRRWMLYWTGDPDGASQLFKMRSDGRDNQQITFSDVTSYRRFIRWSDDGEWFAYTMLEDDGFHIYRGQVDGSNPQLIAITNGEEPAVYMSPDSQWIAYYYRNQITDNFEIFSASTKDGTNYPIVVGRWQPRFRTWSPDSQWIYYHDFDGEKGPLVRMRPDGSDRQVLTDPDHYADFGEWSTVIDLPYTPPILLALSTILIGRGLCTSYLYSRP